MDLLDLAEDTPKRPIASAPKPWRLALVHPSAQRVLDTRTAALARLGAEGFEVHVFAPEHPALSSLQARAGIVPRALPVGAGVSPLPTLAAFLILQGALAERRFLIAHGEGAAMPWLSASCAVQAEVPAVLSTVDTHDLPLPDSTLISGALSALAPYLDVAGARLYGWLGERSDAYVVTTTEGIAAARALDLDPKLIEPWVGADGADHDRFRPETSRQEARAALDVPDSWDVTVGACGKLDARRGARELEQLARALARRPELRVGVVVAARSALSKPLRAALTALGDRALVLEGDVDRMDLFHAAVDLFVAPRRTAHTPTAVHEALASGTPVVAYATDTMSVAVTHNGSGSLTNPGDVDAWVDRVLDLSARPERLARMSEAAASSSRRRFSRPAAHQRLLSLYETALERGLTL